MYSVTTFEAFIVFQFRTLGKGHLTNKGKIVRTILSQRYLYDSPGANGYMVKASSAYNCIVWVLKMSILTHAFRQCWFFFFFFFFFFCERMDADLQRAFTNLRRCI